MRIFSILFCCVAVTACSNESSESKANEQEVRMLTTELEIQEALVEYSELIEAQALELVGGESLGNAGNSSENYNRIQELEKQLNLSKEFMNEQQQKAYSEITD